MSKKVVGISKSAVVYLFDGHTLEEAIDRVHDKLKDYQVHNKFEDNYLEIQETSNDEFMFLKRNNKIKKIKRKKEKKEKYRRNQASAKYDFLDGGY